MKKWAFSALVYLLVVIGGYAIYDSTIKEETSAAEENNHQEQISENEEHGHGEEGTGHENNSGDTEEHGKTHGDSHATESEVDVNVGYTEQLLNIELTDMQGNGVTDLEINHEKFMHVIVVDDHLDTYHHVHPTDLGAGKYEVPIELEDGNYKVFVDIKPKELAYEVQPLSLKIGNPDNHGHGLTPDSTFTREIEGKTVELKLSSQTVGEPVRLEFELDEQTLEPYLGALGHVVILDEGAENYLHVHPEDSNKPVFGTQFDKAGTYKIWAEFKQEGVVRVFPFVVEIK